MDFRAATVAQTSERPPSRGPLARSLGYESGRGDGPRLVPLQDRGRRALSQTRRGRRRPGAGLLMNGLVPSRHRQGLGHHLDDATNDRPVVTVLRLVGARAIRSRALNRDDVPDVVGLAGANGVEAVRDHLDPPGRHVGAVPPRGGRTCHLHQGGPHRRLVAVGSPELRVVRDASGETKRSNPRWGRAIKGSPPCAGAASVRSAEDDLLLPRRRRRRKDSLRLVIAVICSRRSGSDR